MNSNQMWVEEKRRRGKKAVLVSVFFSLMTVVLGISLNRMPTSNGMAIVLVSGLNVVFYLPFGIKDLCGKSAVNYIADTESLVMESAGKRTEITYSHMIKLVAVTGKEAGIFVECKDGKVYYLDGAGISCRKMKRLFETLTEKTEGECVEFQPEHIEWRNQSLSLCPILFCSALSFLLPGILCLLS